jgi:polygalacturonase
MTNTARKIWLMILCIFCCLQVNAQTADSASLAWVSQVGAKKAPTGTTVFLANDYGATNDGKTLNSKAIQSAIDACAAKGGGIVAFKPGSYFTGSVFVKSGVNLRIDEGVTLLGSQDLKDYPEMDTRIAGIELKWPSALINVVGQDTAAVTGKGIIHAQGKPFWDKYWATRRDYETKGLRWIVDYDVKRPRTLLVAECTNVTVSGLTFKQAAMWTVHILYSKNVTCDGITIQNNVDGSGPSTDGIDVDSSSYVLVQNSDIDCNDDNFCIKAGRDWDGLRVNRPAEYIVIRDCISRKGGGLITFGSETSGGFRHILAKGLKATGTGVGIRFKSARTRGGTIEDIYIEDVQMEGVEVALEVSMNWNPSYSYSTLPEGYDIRTVPAHWKTMLEEVKPAEKGIPHFKNVHISRVKVKNGRTAMAVAGTQESIVKDFTLNDVDMEAQRAGSINYAHGWKFKNVSVKTPDNVPVRVQNSTEMDL